MKIKTILVTLLFSWSTLAEHPVIVQILEVKESNLSELFATESSLGIMAEELRQIADELETKDSALSEVKFVTESGKELGAEELRQMADKIESRKSHSLRNYIKQLEAQGKTLTAIRNRKHSD